MSHARASTKAAQPKMRRGRFARCSSQKRFVRERDCLRQGHLIFAATATITGKYLSAVHDAVTVAAALQAHPGAGQVGLERYFARGCAINGTNLSHDLPHSLGQARLGVISTAAGRLFFKPE
jgi:hypothetical protein